jgi:hypothetical protein
MEGKKMITETDCFWIWDTEKDKEQAVRLEERVKSKLIEEFEKIDKSSLTPLNKWFKFKDYLNKLKEKK